MRNKVKSASGEKEKKALLKNVKVYLDKKGLQLVSRALHFAKKAHSGQKRVSGQSYIAHPLFVARILSDLRLDENSIAAALLHDVCEDTPTSPEEIKEKFGIEVAQIVASLTKLKKISISDKKLEKFDQKTLIEINALRRVFFAMAQDLRVVIIKIVDRLHNIKDIKVFDRKKQLRIARETLYIYAPLASRLGMGEFKANLEDGAFKVINPQRYSAIKKHFKKILNRARGTIKQTRKDLTRLLQEAGIEADISSRVKNIYSTHKKLIKIRNNYERILDLLGIRIIVEDKTTCYKVLALVHEQYRLIIGHFSDYIALPKLNGYQSIHTIVRLNNGIPLEIQIRTKEMDYQANYGVASHFYYTEILEPKEKDNRRGIKTPKKELTWIKELAEWQLKMKDSDIYLKELKIDFFNNRIFVFTPKGDVKDLPQGSTPIDFAYSVHSWVGDHACGAKIDGAMRALDYKLKNGEVVEILINKDQKGPNPDWLEFIQSSSAKDKIRSYINKLKKENSFIGK